MINAVRNGHIKRLTDADIGSSVLELAGTNVSTTYIVCPSDGSPGGGASGAGLGIKLQYLVMVIKNMKKYLTFEVTILDDKNVRRRFRASNFQTTTRVKPFICTMPLRLDDGWNQVQFNLADFTRRAYGTNYVETLRVQIHANCRLRRIFFADRLYSDAELPSEYKLFKPAQRQAAATATSAARTSAALVSARPNAAAPASAAAAVASPAATSIELPAASLSPTAANEQLPVSQSGDAAAAVAAVTHMDAMNEAPPIPAAPAPVAEEISATANFIDSALAVTPAQVVDDDTDVGGEAPAAVDDSDGEVGDSTSGCGGGIEIESMAVEGGAINIAIESAAAAAVDLAAVSSATPAAAADTERAAASAMPAASDGVPLSARSSGLSVPGE